ncbi:gamma-glutamylcyclotransferase [Novispirillum sp. DQ9]|uniref:gamma-glutamylcyclotransferase n=1 Tax=Novispirillum sp. DQ9 TaxID=3398612 RepID=UPI003C79B00B
MKTREDILGGSFLRMVRDSQGLIPTFSDEDLAAGQAAALAAAPAAVRDGGDAWVFGYGSLMWNPAIRYEESRIATLHGFHRRFCLWSPVGRGSAEHPGLVLGLARGGSCKGVAYRIKGEHVDEEFSVLWRREMISDGYIPRWVTLRTAEGPLAALAFTINRACPRYAGRLPDDEAARAIAVAAGALGTNAEYLLSTVEHLDALGIPDRRLHALRRRLLEVS